MSDFLSLYNQERGGVAQPPVLSPPLPPRRPSVAAGLVATPEYQKELAARPALDLASLARAPAEAPPEVPSVRGRSVAEAFPGVKALPSVAKSDEFTTDVTGPAPKPRLAGWEKAKALAEKLDIPQPTVTSTQDLIESVAPPEESSFTGKVGYTAGQIARGIPHIGKALLVDAPMIGTKNVIGALEETGAIPRTPHGFDLKEAERTAGKLGEAANLAVGYMGQQVRHPIKMLDRDPLGTGLTLAALAAGGAGAVGDVAQAARLAKTLGVAGQEAGGSRILGFAGPRIGGASTRLPIAAEELTKMLRTPKWSEARGLGKVEPAARTVQKVAGEIGILPLRTALTPMPWFPASLPSRAAALAAKLPGGAEWMLAGPKRAAVTEALLTRPEMEAAMSRAAPTVGEAFTARDVARFAGPEAMSEALHKAEALPPAPHPFTGEQAPMRQITSDLMELPSELEKRRLRAEAFETTGPAGEPLSPGEFIRRKLTREHLPETFPTQESKGGFRTEIYEVDEKGQATGRLWADPNQVPADLPTSQLRTRSVAQRLPELTPPLPPRQIAPVDPFGGPNLPALQTEGVGVSRFGATVLPPPTMGPTTVATTSKPGFETLKTTTQRPGVAVSTTPDVLRYESKGAGKEIPRKRLLQPEFVPTEGGPTPGFPVPPELTKPRSLEIAGVQKPPGTSGRALRRIEKGKKAAQAMGVSTLPPPEILATTETPYFAEMPVVSRSLRVPVESSIRAPIPVMPPPGFSAADKAMAQATGKAVAPGPPTLKPPPPLPRGDEFRKIEAPPMRAVDLPGGVRPGPRGDVVTPRVQAVKSGEFPSLAQPLAGQKVPGVTPGVAPSVLSEEEFYIGKNLHGTSRPISDRPDTTINQSGFYTTEKPEHARWYATSDIRNEPGGQPRIYAAQPPRNPLDLRQNAGFEKILPRLEADAAAVDNAYLDGLPNPLTGKPFDRSPAAFVKAVANLRRSVTTNPAHVTESLFHDVALEHGKLRGLDIDTSYVKDVVSRAGHDAYIGSETIPGGGPERHQVTVYTTLPPMQTYDDYVRATKASRLPTAAISAHRLGPLPPEIPSLKPGMEVKTRVRGVESPTQAAQREATAAADLNVERMNREAATKDYTARRAAQADLSPEVQKGLDVAMEGRTVIDQQSQRLRQLGIIGEAPVGENLGSYLVRGRSMKLIEKTNPELYAYLQKEMKKAVALEDPAQVDHAMRGVWRHLPAQVQRDLYGLVHKDYQSGMIATARQQADLLAGAEFKAALDTPETTWLATKDNAIPPEGWEQVPSTKTPSGRFDYGTLAGKYIPPQHMRALKLLDKWQQWEPKGPWQMSADAWAALKILPPANIGGLFRNLYSFLAGQQVMGRLSAFPDYDGTASAVLKERMRGTGPHVDEFNLFGGGSTIYNPGAARAANIVAKSMWQKATGPNWNPVAWFQDAATDAATWKWWKSRGAQAGGELYGEVDLLGKNLAFSRLRNAQRAYAQGGDSAVRAFRDVEAVFGPDEAIRMLTGGGKTAMEFSGYVGLAYDELPGASQWIAKNVSRFERFPAASSQQIASYLSRNPIHARLTQLAGQMGDRMTYQLYWSDPEQGPRDLQMLREGLGDAMPLGEYITPTGERKIRTIPLAAVMPQAGLITPEPKFVSLPEPMKALREGDILGAIGSGLHAGVAPFIAKMASHPVAGSFLDVLPLGDNMPRVRVSRGPALFSGDVTTPGTDSLAGLSDEDKRWLAASDLSKRWSMPILYHVARAIRGLQGEPDLATGQPVSVSEAAVKGILGLGFSTADMNTMMERFGQRGKAAISAVKATGTARAKRAEQTGAAWGPEQEATLEELAAKYERQLAPLTGEPIGHRAEEIFQKPIRLVVPK